MKFTMPNLMQRFMLLPGVLCLALLSLAPAKADVPFVVDAIEKAKSEGTAEGKWQVTANVVFTSEASGTMTASGPLEWVGNPTDGLKGIIPMTIGDDAETAKTNALGLVVKADGTVGIQWLISGKPFLGRPTFVFQPNAFPNYLSKKLNWGGAVRRMQLTLSPEKVLTGGVRTDKEENKPAIRVRNKKEPIGKRYKITGYAHVTNADDGVGDNSVEVLGSVTIKYRTGEKWVETEVIPLEKARSLTKNDSIDFQELIVDSLFSNPTAYIYIFGDFVDVDKASGNDLMWRTGSKRFTLDKCVALKGQSVIPGDRDDENIEVYFTVKEAGDIF